MSKLGNAQVKTRIFHQNKHIRLKINQVLFTKTDVAQNSSQIKQYFYQSVLNILEMQKMSSYEKSDAIAEAFIGLEIKLDYIKEQQKLLSKLKKQIEIATEFAKEEVSKAFLSLGVSKLEGLKVSSITASKETNKTVTKLQILNEDELLKAGYFKVELDREAVEQALLSADKF